jgi:hypothetical protein
MSGKKFIERMTGYKATNKDIQCLNFQFTPGEWHEHEGEIALCGAGFHFCDHPSGPWAYCSDHETRIWKVEAEQILDLPTKPGADHKRVCKRIRLVEELRIVGNRNTGYGNTGDGNTGNRNTGYGNTGDGNTGNGNATNCSSGFFCTSAPKVLSFDEPTEFTSEEYCDKFPQYLGLCKALALDAEIDFERFKELPNITPEKIKALHEQHKKGREAA